ncbi:GFA family protein [Oleiagrimonas citrea]|uniref:GFA family protein n=1 Tax=Oleiagrimonas citrea TaxID=1665687 RepID=UPI001877B028|nr:GFA family protein [Oleiagrimonas citrea]
MSVTTNVSARRASLIKGQCLCGSVEFEITGPLPDFYQCHCSLCRKLSGSASDTATFLAKELFSWIKGQKGIRVFKTDSGYRSEFCDTCGSTVPHLMDNGRQYWIPAGLLANALDSQVVAHLFVGSKAAWDHVEGNGKGYTEMPDFEELNAALHQRIAAQQHVAGDA